MSLDNFIPTLWANELLVNLFNQHVYGSAGVINRDYEGQIQNAGDSVKINSIGRVTIGSYTKNTDISAAETLTDAQSTLTVDQQKYFNFQVDDVDRAQQNPKVMAAAMVEAAYGLRDAVDTFIAGKYTEGTDAVGSTGSPVTVTSPVTSSNKLAYEYLVDLGVALDTTNTPADGRFCVVPPWYHGLLLVDQRFVGFGTAAQQEALVNGRVGRAAGFDIFKSNNVPNSTATKYKVIAGHPIAWSFAAQITSVEGYRPQARFADAVKGLMVYGAKVTRPSALAVMTANFA